MGNRINFITIRCIEDYQVPHHAPMYIVDAVVMDHHGNGTTVISVDCNTKSQAMELAKRVMGATTFLPAS